MAHSRLSGSKVDAWTRCAGMIPATESLNIVNKTNPAASLGTSAHYLGEICLINNTKPKDYIWSEILILADKEREIVEKRTDDHDITIKSHIIDHDMVNAVTIYVNHVNKVFNFLDDPKLIIEKKTTPLPQRNDTGGTCDAIIYNDDVMNVIDYKHGTGVYVPIENNGQLLSYLLGAAREQGFKQSEYIFTVVQPRYEYKIDGRRVPALNLKKKNYGVRSQTVTRNQLLKWSGWLNRRAQNVDTATFDLIKNDNIITSLWSEKYLVAGNHCKFCPVKSSCEAYQKDKNGDEW